MQRGFDWSKSQFSLKINELNYKNFYYLNNKKNKKILYNYSFRIFVFFKLNEYLKVNNFKKKNFLNILFLNYSLLWNFFLQTKNPQLYYYLIKLVSIRYKNLFFSTNLDIFFKNNAGSFSNFLNFFNLNFNNKKKITFNNLKIINFFLEKNLNLNNFKINQIYIENELTFFKKNFGNSKFVINFLRVQRRYNKRRYSKVRAISRPSFFGGISLSSIFLGLLWGGSIKGVDWLTSWIIVIDMNFFFFSVFFYFIFRIWRLSYFNTFVRKKNKIKIINSLHNMFIFKFFLKN